MKKIVVVTGASGGIGKEVALLYLLKGYTVIVTARNENKLKEFSSFENIEIVAGDITEEKTLNSIKELIDSKFKHIDILINNAGITYIQSFESNTNEQLDDIIETNLKAPMKLTRLLYPYMMNQKSGHIVIVNSSAGKEPKLFHTMYCAAKYGLYGFAAALRLESKKHNIRVTSFHPGGVNTCLYNNLTENKPDLSTFMDPVKVAEVLVYLTETEGLSPDEIVLNRLSK